jgi:superfamily II DNA or RNA helicase
VGTLAELLANLSPDPGLKGKQFEHICKWFLTNDPVYRSELRRVWLWDEWPGRWGADAGIDLVAEEHGGRLWAIQAKAYDPANTVTKADVDTFLSESARPEFAFRLLVTTTDRIGKTAERTLKAQEKPAGRLLLADLRAAQDSWPSSPSNLRAAKAKPKRPRPHQREAIRAVVKGFENADRGQMIMACGTGKTLTALFIAERLSAKRTLVLVPSLQLLSDSLRDWTANAKGFDFLPVCSDETVSGQDAALSTTVDLGFPVTTDPTAIATFLRRRSGPQVVFATYQSSPRIAEAYRLGRVPKFDLVIADEAHRCAGRVSSDFATVLDSDAIPAKRRLFMTATPRFFTGRVITEAKEADFEVASMDDESRFGPVLHRLGFSEAIERGLLTDYQVVVVGVDDDTYLDWARNGRFVTMDGTSVTDARTLAGQIGLVKAMRKYDLQRTITFHSRVSSARKFASSLPEIVDWMPARQRPKGQLWSDYASGEMTAGSRSALLDHLRHLDDGKRGLLANARCLGEGVDVPALDGVAFIDPRRSEVDIVQAVGRAIRLAEDKKIGTIVIPVFIESQDDAEAVLDGSEFKPVWDVIKALRAHDDELGRQLDELRRELGRSGEKHRRTPSPKTHFDLPAGISVDFVDAFNARLIAQTTATWEFWYGLLERLAKSEGIAHMPSDCIIDGHQLGYWVANQRAIHSRGLLSDDSTARLEMVPGWLWNPRDARWEEAYSLLCDYAARAGDARVPQSYEQNGIRLGNWVNTQRNLHTRMSPERQKRLEQVPGWVWGLADARWEDAFGLLLAYAKRKGGAVVPVDYVEGDFRLGQWVRGQRSRGERLEPERRSRLEAVPGWVWNPNDARWEEAYSLLCAYAMRVGNANVPRNHLEAGFRLGQWVIVQRSRQKDPKRRERLEQIHGWVWDSRDSKWGEAYELLCAYVRRVGNASVPPSHVEAGFRLGRWVIKQRSGQKGQERRRRLEQLPGWEWDAYESQWEEAYKLLCIYVEREGDALVPQKHIEADFNLGMWVSGQRHWRQTMSSERRALLERLPGWAWNAREAQWEKAYRLLYTYVEREGNALVPAKHVEAGFLLGGWVTHQRVIRSQMDPDRLKRLDELGFVWQSR